MLAFGGTLLVSPGTESGPSGASKPTATWPMVDPTDPAVPDINHGPTLAATVPMHWIQVSFIPSQPAEFGPMSVVLREPAVQVTMERPLADPGNNASKQAVCKISRAPGAVSVDVGGTYISMTWIFS